MNKYRSHNCSELNEKEINKVVHLSVVTEKDHGNLLFIDLRSLWNYSMQLLKIIMSFSNIRKI